MADVLFSEIDKLANSMKTSNRLMNWPVDFEKKVFKTDLIIGDGKNKLSCSLED